MTDAELHDWAMERYGSEKIANNAALVRRLMADVETVETHGDFPPGDEIPHSSFRASLNERLRRAGRPELPLTGIPQETDDE